MEKPGETVDNTRNMQILLEVLKSGCSVELQATGYSMFPSLRPGDRITINPVSSETALKPGTVVVYFKDDQLVMHRIIGIAGEKDGIFQVITRGDSQDRNDNPVSPGQILGIAVKLKRNGREYPVRFRRIGNFRCLFNRMVLSGYLKIRYLILSLTGKF